VLNCSSTLFFYYIYISLLYLYIYPSCWLCWPCCSSHQVHGSSVSLCSRSQCMIMMHCMVGVFELRDYCSYYRLTSPSICVTFQTWIYSWAKHLPLLLCAIYTYRAMPHACGYGNGLLPDLRMLIPNGPWDCSLHWKCSKVGTAIDYNSMLSTHYLMPIYALPVLCCAADGCGKELHCHIRQRVLQSPCSIQLPGQSWCKQLFTEADAGIQHVCKSWAVRLT